MDVAKTFAALNDYFWFKGIRPAVKNIVLQCDLCQRVKSLNKSMAGPFLPISQTRPNEFIAIDFYSSLTRLLGGGVKYILVVLDVFSRLATVYPLKKATTLATINRLN